MTTNFVPGFVEGLAPASTVSYIVTVTNGTSDVFPLTYVGYARTLMPPGLHRIPNLAPGASVTLPIGTLGDLGFYTIAVFDTDGHMVARFPNDLNAMTPAKAAQLDPLRPDSHTDSWSITPAEGLNLSETYLVEVVNETEDTWDEVALFFTNRTYGTIGFASEPVEPGKKVTFNLGPSGEMDGYVFSIFVGGLRAYLAPEALQFPPTGLMTAELSARYHLDLHPTKDSWAIGSDE